MIRIFVPDMEKRHYSTEPKELYLIAKAMGHPTRMSLLEFLAARHSSIFGEIHSSFPMAKATLSQHLAELRDSGLVQCENEGTKVRYSINRDNWRQAKLAYTEFFANIYRERGII